MPELLLINPAKRRKARKARKAPAAKRRTRKVRRNPLTVAAVKKAYRTRRAAPKSARKMRRRRNPIGGKKLSVNGIMAMAKQAAIGGAGVVGMDVVMGQLNRYLPPSLMDDGNAVGVHAAVRAAATVALGKGLAKLTRGLSEKMALGALTVQAADAGRQMVAQYAPAAVAGGRMGYAVANPVVPGTARIGPVIRTRPSMGAFTRNNSATPLLSAYNSAGAPSPLLSGARRRDNVRR